MLKKLEEYLEKFLLRSDSADKEFLPPAVEILEKPPSPAGRKLVWAIVILFFLIYYCKAFECRNTSIKWSYL